MEDIQPLPKNLHDKAKKLGVTQIHLNFSGGNDEGYLSVFVEGIKDARQEEDFADEVETWADSAYHYNGAGDGTDYGDDITYDLVTNEASCSEWCMARTEGETETIDLVVDETDGEDDK